MYTRRGALCDFRVNSIEKISLTSRDKSYARFAFRVVSGGSAYCKRKTIFPFLKRLKLARRTMCGVVSCHDRRLTKKKTQKNI